MKLNSINADTIQQTLIEQAQGSVAHAVKIYEQISKKLENARPGECVSGTIKVREKIDPKVHCKVVELRQWKNASNAVMDLLREDPRVLATQVNSTGSQAEGSDWVERSYDFYVRLEPKRNTTIQKQG